jgi:2-C-methyl-D-erythritol 4-phosphate cytidylyltransferase
MKLFIIIPAAGLGTRMRAHVSASQPSKQFLEIGGAPILVHTLRRFAALPQVTQIVLALRENELTGFGPEIARQVPGDKIALVKGGETRQQSVANALRSLNAAADDVVLVHDAVRPFIEAAVVEKVVAAIVKYGAAIVGVGATDTIKQVERYPDGAIIRATIPREQIVQAQTPQGARFPLLKQAFDAAEAEEFTGTDEASLLEHIGQEVHVVTGSPRNIKITTPADLELAGFYLEQMARERK